MPRGLSPVAYDTPEEAINANNDATIVIAEDAAPLALDKLTADKSFKVSATGVRPKWTDGMTGKFIAVAVVEGEDVFTVKSGTPANGRDSYESYVLNLNAIDATDKPFIKAVQAANDPLGKITFNFFHGTAGSQISPRTDVGVTVKYAVLTASSPTAAADDWKTGGEPTTENSVSVDLPVDPEGPKVRYYRPKFTFE